MNRVGELPPPGVVEVDNCQSRSQFPEQARLGCEVVVHRRMEVQVVSGQVREDRDREVNGVGAAQRKRVRGNLHRACRIAGGDHLSEGVLHVDRLGRRPHDGVLDPADHARDGA